MPESPAVIHLSVFWFVVIVIAAIIVGGAIIIWLLRKAAEYAVGSSLW